MHTNRSGSAGLDAVPGRDAGVTAASIAGRLSKLEAQLSSASAMQSDVSGAPQQMVALQVCECGVVSVTLHQLNPSCFFYIGCTICLLTHTEL